MSLAAESVQLASRFTVSYEEVENDVASCHMENPKGLDRFNSDASTDLLSDQDQESLWDVDKDSKNGDGARVFSSDETLIIFDWDDTLLPTTWLVEQGLTAKVTAIKHWHRVELKALADRAEQTLRDAKKLGQVLIITNAKSGWVELSCRRFMPTLCPLLQELKVISARSLHESPSMQNPTDWKRQAFAKEITAFHREHCFANLLSIGDSIFEQEALEYASQLVGTCHAKNIKFDERPSPRRLAEQHEELARNFVAYVDSDGDFKVSMNDDWMPAIVDKLQALLV